MIAQPSKSHNDLAKLVVREVKHYSTVSARSSDENLKAAETGRPDAGVLVREMMVGQKKEGRVLVTGCGPETLRDVSGGVLIVILLDLSHRSRQNTMGPLILATSTHTRIRKWPQTGWLPTGHNRARSKKKTKTICLKSKDVPSRSKKRFRHGELNLIGR